MKVLMIIAERNYGLGSLLTGQAIAYNSTDGIDIEIITGCTEKEPGLFDKLNESGVSYYKIKDLEYNREFFKRAADLRSVILKVKPEFVHVQTNWQLALCVFIKIYFRQSFKIIDTIHAFRHNHYLKSLLARFLIGIALFLFVNKIIVCSNYVKNKFWLLSYKMKLIYLGVDKQFLNKTDNIDLKYLGNINLTFPAEFRKGKNQDVLIKNLAKYIKSKKTVPHLKLILPGEGALKQKCIDLVKQLNIVEYVEFPGWVNKDTIVSIIKNSSIAFITTNSETFGLCIAEPFSYGRCVVSRNVGVAPDIILNGVNGFIFKKDEELYEIIENLIENRHLIYETGNRAFEQRELFDWNSIAYQYKSFLGS